MYRTWNIPVVSKFPSSRFRRVKIFFSFVSFSRLVVCSVETVTQRTDEACGTSHIFGSPLRDSRTASANRPWSDSCKPCVCRAGFSDRRFWHASFSVAFLFAVQTFLQEGWSQKFVRRFDKRHMCERNYRFTRQSNCGGEVCCVL